jgi:ferredoxin-type protein NapH
VKYASFRKKSMVSPAIGVALGVVILLWYIVPYPWLGAAMGLIAGLLIYGILRNGRIERLRRVFFVCIMGLAVITLSSYAFYMGTHAFRQFVSSWNWAYYFPGITSTGAMPFPTPVVMPAILWRGARFLADFGVWQTAVPTSMLMFFVFMLPGILIAAIFGRAICGWLCPLGGLPELAAVIGGNKHLPGFLGERRVSRDGVKYTTPKAWVHSIRYVILGGVLILSLSVGFSLINIFYPVLWLKSTPAFWTVATILVVFGVALPALTKRRWWCFVCPVGAVLSVLERTSLFRLRIDKNKCNRCMDCARACRSYALTPQNLEDGVYRGELCVRCGRCTEACSENAIDFTLLGTRRSAKASFIALITGIGFAFYAWFAIESTYLLLHFGNFRWFG